MKIIKVEIRDVVLPMLGSFTTGFGTIIDKHEIIVKLHADNGLIGYGEAPTLNQAIYNHETTQSCIHTLQESITPRILHRNFDTAMEFRLSYADIVGNLSAKNGAEGAFWHLVSQRDNISLKKLFGGVHTEIPVGEGVGIKETVEELLDDIQHFLDLGFIRIKVKIKPGWDIKPLRAIRDHWPDIELTVDGNSAYDYITDSQSLLSLASFKIDMIEQPLATDDFIDHATLQKALQIPVCLDESIESLNDARTAIALEACKVINIKSGRVGGMIEAMAIHDYAEANNISVWSGGMLETGIGRAFNLALASKSNYRHAADMSPYQLYYADDITEPGLLIKSNGCIDVPDVPGLGFTIREDKLEKYTINNIILE